MNSPLVKQQRIKAIYFLLSMLALFGSLIFVQNLLVSFILAYVIFVLLRPLSDALERRHYPRAVSVAVPFFVVGTLVIGGASLIFPVLFGQARALQMDFPHYLDSVNGLLDNLESRITALQIPVPDIHVKEKVIPFAIAYLTDFFQRVPEILSQSLTILILAPFLAFFMLLDGRAFVRSVIQLVPNRIFELVLSLNQQVGEQMGGYVRARLLESLVVGIFLWVPLAIMGFPFALLIAVFGAITSIIPYLGPVIGFLPAILVSVSHGIQTTELLELTIIFGCAHIVDNVILVPFMLARIIDLHPVIVVLAVIIGGQFMGVLGMVISIPLVSAIKVVSSVIYRHLTRARPT